MTEFETELLQLARALERRVERLERQASEQPLDMADADEEQLSPPWIVYYTDGEIAHGTTDLGAWETFGMSVFNEFVNGFAVQTDDQNHLLSVSADLRTLDGDDVWVQIVDVGGSSTQVQHIGPDDPGVWYDLSNGAYFDATGHFVTVPEPPE